MYICWVASFLGLPVKYHGRRWGLFFRYRGLDFPTPFRLIALFSISPSFPIVDLYSIFRVRAWHFHTSKGVGPSIPCLVDRVHCVIASPLLPHRAFSTFPPSSGVFQVWLLEASSILFSTLPSCSHPSSPPSGHHPPRSRELPGDPLAMLAKIPPRPATGRSSAGTPTASPPRFSPSAV